MSKIEQILKLVSKSDYESLMYALESGSTYIVNLPDGKYIGVNVFGKESEFEQGVWSYGKL